MAAGTGAILPPSSRKATGLATVVLVIGCLIAGVSMPEAFDEVAVFRHCAIVLLISLALSLTIQAAGNPRRLIRADVVALFTLYFLTFAEFLSPNLRVLFSGYTGMAHQACWMVLATFMAIAIGRLVPLPVGRKPWGMPSISLAGFFAIAVACFFLGFLWPLISVNFNLVTLVDAALGPRFSQPWERGRIGGWASFLTELDLLHYAYAALLGVMLGGRAKIPMPMLVALGAMAAFMLFMDFAGGTRYVLVVKVGLVISGYVASNSRVSSAKFWTAALLGMGLIWFASGAMLRLRSQGVENFNSVNPIADSAGDFLIDNNMFTIARAAAAFPERYAYPGSDIVVATLTKWVPRALWPGKPEDWGTSLEDAFGLDGSYTLAVTVTGEAYLINGWLSLIVVSLLIGMFCGVWNRLGEMARTNLDLVLFVSIFFPLAISMRSLQFVSVALLPTLALYLFGKFLASQGRTRLAGRRRASAGGYPLSLKRS